MESLWATPQGLIKQRDVRKDNPETLLGPLACTTAHHPKTGLRCSFGGAAEVRALDSLQWNDTSSWAAIDQPLPPAMGMLAGMVYSLPATFGQALPVIPFHPAVVEQARTVIDQLPAIVAANTTNSAAARPVSMCAHIRRGDLASRQPPIAKVVLDILRFMASVEPRYRVGKLFLIHNANASEGEDLQNGLPPGIQFSCDSEKWAMCSSSTLQIAVEQAACSMTDLFLGSRGSSFSDLIKEYRIVLHNKTRRSNGYTGMTDKLYDVEVS
ncbi:uncharacterized protein ACA1_174570 [Acanthamoeba castellanii str. Neff]|uniref:Uncharacterized protein n=1 Tax=Acanthamoeba castellanii (strain ATCC 30010 / Neff) TaxID=1257118 RepID=L8HK64_ACACF|nr:uncharacterized protein ACA1_174570 [Acanthamoeba castellanii str. Neff]ELR24796.1 hypothetical protein ACA1_174570 [Acanthamoeba castellanii str. Neff]